MTCRQPQRRKLHGPVLALCAVALLTVLLYVSRASAHDLLDAGEAARYLQRIDELNTAIIKEGSVAHKAEALFAHHPTYQNREEVLFILAVDYVRAARQAPDAALQTFHTTYPNSLRTVAAHMLLERLPAAEYYPFAR
jgi:hypothetical protein